MWGLRSLCLRLRRGACSLSPGNLTPVGACGTGECAGSREVGGEGTNERELELWRAQSICTLSGVLSDQTPKRQLFVFFPVAVI